MFGTTCPLRIGHGVGFLSFAQLFDAPDLCSPLARRVVDALRLMGKRRTAIEMNLRSNEILVRGRLGNLDAVRIFEHLGMSVMLCTDNDGIWDCRADLGGVAFRSVAGEFARAIAFGFVVNEDMAQRMVRAANLSRFDEVQGIQRHRIAGAAGHKAQREPPSLALSPDTRSSPAVVSVSYTRDHVSGAVPAISRAAFEAPRSHASSHAAECFKPASVRSVPQRTGVVVLGASGAGKTTLVNYLCHSNRPCGESADPITQATEVIECSTIPGLFFVDTPGLRDRHRSDHDIMLEILIASKENALPLGAIFFIFSDNTVRRVSMVTEVIEVMSSLHPDIRERIIIWNKCPDISTVTLGQNYGCNAVFFPFDARTKLYSFAIDDFWVLLRPGAPICWNQDDECVICRVREDHRLVFSTKQCYKHGSKLSMPRLIFLMRQLCSFSNWSL